MKLVLFVGACVCLWTPSPRLAGHFPAYAAQNTIYYNLREFALCNSRHPGPLHVWKGGSDLLGLRSVPPNPLEFRLIFTLSNLVRNRGT